MYLRISPSLVRNWLACRIVKRRVWSPSKPLSWSTLDSRSLTDQRMAVSMSNELWEVLGDHWKYRLPEPVAVQAIVPFLPHRFSAVPLKG